jgi:hypothetical protein
MLDGLLKRLGLVNLFFHKSTLPKQAR